MPLRIITSIILCEAFLAPGLEGLCWKNVTEECLYICEAQATENRHHCIIDAAEPKKTFITNLLTSFSNGDDLAKMILLLSNQGKCRVITYRVAKLAVVAQTLQTSAVN